MNDYRSTTLLGALILAVGLFAAGYSISKAQVKIKQLSRSIVVKGIAEKKVKSDLGIWEINYREVGNNLVELDQRVQHDQEALMEFLKKQGFTDDEMGTANFKVEDRLANIYNTQSNMPAANEQRFVVTAGVRVRSVHVDLIQKSVQLIDRLLQQGIPLAFDVSSLSPNPSYYFTHLDTIRPEMLSDATKSAKELALQFAHDTDNEVSAIQHASQGVFQIMDADTSTMSADWNSNQSALGSINKMVRLVTTIDYRLK
ncbi:MAG TPA: SIMPL domain-containing protein [Gammaproteobacteria bacterium]|jgi:hypothetical protein|nr:SIMPL domain-containing protein [Gammaproteobacteria bacterium]